EMVYPEIELEMTQVGELNDDGHSIRFIDSNLVILNSIDLSVLNINNPQVVIGIPNSVSLEEINSVDLNFDDFNRITITKKDGSIIYGSLGISIFGAYAPYLKNGPIELSFYDPLIDGDIGQELTKIEGTDRFNGLQSTRLYIIAKLTDQVEVVEKEFETLEDFNDYNYIDNLEDVENLEEIRETLLAGKYPIIKKTYTPDPNTVSFTYSCNQEECIYPLPGVEGENGYTIENKYPALYEMYVSYRDGDSIKEIPVGQRLEGFKHPGNIIVRKVPQQILYVNSINEDGDIDQAFYSCQGGDYLDDGITADDVLVTSANPLTNSFQTSEFCTIKNDKFCSYSDAHNGATTASVWTEDTVTSGYEPILTNPEIEELDGLLELNDEIITAPSREYSTMIVPARNMLGNADFQENRQQAEGETISGADLKDLLYWELYVQETMDGKMVIVPHPELEYDHRTGEDHDQFMLANNQEILRTDKIAIPQNKRLQFSHEGTCTSVQAKLYDSNGNEHLTSATASFDTGTNTFLILEFNNCAGKTVYKPMLQVLDTTPAEYHYRERHDSTENPRSGQACCPKDYCWNGYACIAPMTDSVLAEHITAGQDYRCIQGEWVALNRLSDWNDDQYGFCQEEGQCYVISSNDPDADLTDTIVASSTRDGQTNFHDQAAVRFPVCINDSEFLLDHFCDDGNWTSRTKFLAGQLIDISGDDYTIFCTNPFDGLLEYNEKENYLFGVPSLITETSSLIPTATDTTKNGACFQLSGEQAKVLIPAEDNTCINNICLLKDEDDKIIFSTSLNKNIKGSQSFLYTLDLQPESCPAIPADSPELVDCTTGSLPGKLQYAPKINAVIYGKDGIGSSFALEALADTVMEFLRNFLGIDTESEALKFLKESGNFRNIYLLKQGDQEVHAVQDVFPKVATSPSRVLLAEYKNFKTPVCSFVNKDHIPESKFDVDLLQEDEQIKCTEEADTQRVDVLASAGKRESIKWFWPQLTGKLRMEK
ncbi:hypothetical protein HYX12_04045, partial [Candidatus Woesearchaeota archaeon]|nr:hypothetical protein [Candidatus Woesearchaeota archaeon]